jgi:hypothetical protein
MLCHGDNESLLHAETQLFLPNSMKALPCSCVVEVDLFKAYFPILLVRFIVGGGGTKK